MAPGSATSRSYLRTSATNNTQRRPRPARTVRPQRSRAQAIRRGTASANRATKWGTFRSLVGLVMAAAPMAIPMTALTRGRAQGPTTRVLPTGPWLDAVGHILQETLPPATVSAVTVRRRAQNPHARRIDAVSEPTGQGVEDAADVADPIAHAERDAGPGTRRRPMVAARELGARLLIDEVDPASSWVLFMW